MVTVASVHFFGNTYVISIGFRLFFLCEGLLLLVVVAMAVVAIRTGAGDGTSAPVA